MRRVPTSLLLLAMAAGSATADGPETGLVSGTVTDAGSAALPGVPVSIAGERGERYTQTEADGTYRFALLVPGSYTLRASLEGMGEAELPVQVTAGQRSEADLSLTMATAETITVTSEAPLVDKFNAAAGATMPSLVGIEVTGENRSYYGILNFMPGVTNEDENVDLASTRPNVNGATWADSTVYIDGVDTTFARHGGSHVFLPSSAITEVSLESGGLSSDYGRTVGSAANVIVKSGTNVFHGQALGGLTEEKWNSEFKRHPELERIVDNSRPADFFKRTPEEKENNDAQYEVTLGGPLKRDTAWFFVSANKIDTNHTGKTINGDFVDESHVAESRIVKLNLQPSPRHALSVSYIDTPVLRNFVLEPVFDRYGVIPHDTGGVLSAASYNVSVSSQLFLEAKVAGQTSDENKLLAVGGLDIEEAIRLKQQDERFPGNPAAGPDWPGNNYSTYQDFDGWHNGWLLDNGYGTNEFPRTQLNVAFTHFAGANHELKYGVDAQKVEWRGDVQRPNLYSAQRGNVFDSMSRSGYANPVSRNPFGVACDATRDQACIIQDYNHPSLLADLGSNDSSGRNVGLYWRDRFTVGEHFTFNLGMRAENQKHENDVDREVMDSTDFSPRVAVAYDISGDGRRLITGYAGRSYHQLSQEAVNEYLLDHFNGSNGYQRRVYLDCAFIACVPGAPSVRFPLPLGYTFSLGFVRPGFMWDLVDAGVFESDLEANHKDEAIVGYEWQLSRHWAFDGKTIWWEVENLIGSTLQLAELNGRIALFHLTANHEDYPAILNAVREAASPAIQPRLAQADALARYEEPRRDYRALQVQVNRRFADNWALYSNVTWSEAGGSSHGDVFNNTNDTYGAQLEQVLTQRDIDNCQARQVYRKVPVDCHAALTPFLGLPLSMIHRDGRPSFDRTIIAKSSGWKVFPIGQRRRFTLGGHLTWQTGAPWHRVEGLGGGNLSTDGIPQATGVGVSLEPPGSREINSHWWLNTSAAFGFPVARKVDGEARIEVQNATDNQEPVGVVGDGDVRRIRRGFQRPRRFRVLMSFTF